jgi:formylglycine-generating enzyme required for sulfatase activity
MGSPESEKGRNADEGPQHPVTIRPFWMGKTEVTWAEYDLHWQASPGDKKQQIAAEKRGAGTKELDALSRPTPPYADETFGYGREGMPVISMTHHAAMDYCRWLSQKTGKDYRLPTEAEWEWACRAGSKTAYAFGDDPRALGDYAWFADNSEDAPHKVATKKPNAWGLYDMEGNVAEWCLDQYRKDSYATFPLDKPTLEPVLLPTSNRYPHVVRGGSWADKAPGLRCAARRASEKSWNVKDPQIPRSIWWLTDGDFIGFRIVRAVEEQENLKALRSKVKWESK